MKLVSLKAPLVRRRVTPLCGTNTTRQTVRRINALAISKVLMGALTFAASAWIGFENWQRSRTKQMQRINGKLLQPLVLDVPRPAFLKHARSLETRFLKTYLSGHPCGPIFIIGPRGTGKSELVKQVLRGSRMVLYLDLHKTPVSNGEELCYWLIESTGYWVPRNNELARFILREAPRKSRITHEEVDVALDVFDQVLHDEKQKGWPLGVPIICVDDTIKLFDINSDGTVGNFTGNELNSEVRFKDPYLAKFIDWCLHVVDHKLAHLVFVTSASHFQEIDNFAGLRQRRALVWINHPSPEGIKQYLRSEFEKNTAAFEALKRPLPTDVQLNWIVKCIGGHVTDLDQVCTALVRGENFGTILRRMIAESVHYVENRLEAIVKQASKAETDEKRARILEKYLRFWRLMESLRDNPYVPRRDIVNTIFRENIAELDEYVSADIVCYLSRGLAGRPEEDGDQYETTTTTTTNTTTTTTTITGNSAGGTTSASGIPAPTVGIPTATVGAATATTGSATANVPASPQSTTQATTTTNPTSAAQAVDKDGVKKALPTVIDSETQSFMLLTEGLGGVIVSCSSMRVRMAFDSLLNHPRMMKQRRRFEDQLNLKAFTDSRTRLTNEKSDLNKERQVYTDELSHLVINSEKWIKELGQETYSKRKLRVVELEGAVEVKLAAVEKSLGQVSEDIIRLQKKIKREELLLE